MLEHEKWKFHIFLALHRALERVLWYMQVSAAAAAELEKSEFFLSRAQLEQ